MTNKHTPGPWKHDDTWGLIKHGREEICALHSGNSANARLIAAAPELLEALLDALPYVEDVLADPAQLACFKPGVVQKHAAAIRAAVAKATGEQA